MTNDARQAFALLMEDGFEMGAGWNKVHEICQDHEGEAAFDAIHALAHLIEGDRSNSDYWCRRAGIAPLGDNIELAARTVASAFALD